MAKIRNSNPECPAGVRDFSFSNRRFPNEFFYINLFPRHFDRAQALSFNKV